MKLWCLGDDKATQVEILSVSDTNTVPWTVGIGGTPSRILYSQSLEKLVIAYCETHCLDSGASDPSSVTTDARRLSFAKLALVDPADPDARVDEESIEIVGRSGERILGLAEWMVDNGTTKHVLIAVGSVNDQRGRIGLYGRRRTESGIVRLELKKEKTTPEPVYAVAPYNDRLLCYCRGTTLVLAGFVKEDNAHRFSEFGECRLRSPAKSLTVHPPFVYASTMEETLTVLEVHEVDRTVCVRGSSEAAGEGRTHVFLPALSLALAATEHGRVHGLWQPPGDARNCSLRSVFHAQLPSSITRFAAVPARAAGSRDALMAHTGDTAPFPSIAVIGSGFDGAFYRFDLLDEPRWRLLRFLQNLAEVHPVVSPHQRFRGRRYTEPEAAMKPLRQVDGDLLARILDRRGKGAGLEILKELIEDWPDTSTNVGLRDVVDRYTRFYELTEAALGALQGRDPYKTVLLFLREFVPPCARP